eukprot:Pgem_evm1s2012
MREIEYDMNLECVAKTYMYSLKEKKENKNGYKGEKKFEFSDFSHNNGKFGDECKVKNSFGENMVTYGKDDAMEKGIVHLWVDYKWQNGCSERQNYAALNNFKDILLQGDTINPDCAKKKKGSQDASTAGHLTQVLNPKTYKVGCYGVWGILVCNYQEPNIGKFETTTLNGVDRCPTGTHSTSDQLCRRDGYAGFISAATVIPPSTAKEIPAELKAAYYPGTVTPGNSTGTGGPNTGNSQTPTGTSSHVVANVAIIAVTFVINRIW